MEQPEVIAARLRAHVAVNHDGILWSWNDCSETCESLDTALAESLAYYGVQQAPAVAMGGAA